MFGFIHKSQLDPRRWVNTSIFRLDGNEEYRELPAYGNSHAVFPTATDFGGVHYDEHNALDFPAGTVNHLAKYTNEKTGVPEDIAKIAIVAGGVYGFYKLLKYLDENL